MRSEITEALTLLDPHPSNLAFMQSAFEVLQSALPHFRDPDGPVELLELLSLIYVAGRCDLPLARLFEGHIDALQIISRYGGGAVASAVEDLARSGAMFGVWNAPDPHKPLNFGKCGLGGAKSFASGAGILTHALVTTSAGTGDVQLYMVDLSSAPPTIDRSWWDVTGMTRSETHRVEWSGNSSGVTPIGQAGDYERQPWFSGGALRFVAAQAGAIAAIADRTAAVLTDRGHADSPVQASRLGTLAGLAASASALVVQTASSWFDRSDAENLACTALARTMIFDFAEQAIDLSRRAVGVGAAFRAQPICAVLADLEVYLCQPGPDQQRIMVAGAFNDGLLGIGL